MNLDSVYDIIDDDYTLVITVDCGITSFTEIQTFRDNYVDVIVTDHHECKDSLPNANAVLDNKRPDSEYPFGGLCGAGMVFKLLSALYEFMGKKGEEEKFLKYTVIGTVADVMPLLDENRLIVEKGLQQIRNSNEPFILNLLAAAGKLEEKENLTAQDIAFYIGPLLNASSRVGDIKYAMNLLLSTDETESIACAQQMKSFNDQRKEIEKSITEEAYQQIISNYNFSSFAPIVVYGENWHRGVIGIVASRIVDKFHRPAIILSKKTGDSEYHGSCRSYLDIDMLEILNYAKDTIKTFGGHKGAAGLTVEDVNLENFKKKITEYGICNFSSTPEKFLPVKEIDLEIRPEELTMENYEKLQTLEPFGHANEEPLFICRNLKTNVIKRIGQKEGAENAHLKISFSMPDDKLKTIDGVAFFQGDYADILPSGKNVDVVFKLSKNTWQGKTSLQILIDGIIYMPSVENGTSIEEDELYRQEIVDIPDIAEEYGVSLDKLLPSKEEYIDTYKAIKTLIAEPNNSIIITHLHYLTSILSTRTNRELNPFKVARILDVLKDSNNITYKNLMFDEILISAPNTSAPRIRLTQTQSFKKIHGI